ncbi:CLUMA_CG004693, isoform A [Clunio marinus]|uniref:CLUMA_CG004693, isoform A n=1 Tax=Clunio marinus TaxID=568069 RepID=A0A1J1HSM7_9DIPT|nr:CLUMA_CG004693, isoform A [Clunio marinus]
MTSNESTKDSKSSSTLENALVETSFGKFNYLLIVLCGAILACVYLETVSINFVLPVAQCDLNLTNSNKGILSAVGFIGIIISSHLWGFLADTRGRKFVIVPTLFIAFLITVVSSFAKSFWFMVFLRFLNGFFISGPSATIYAFLGEFHSAKDRSRVLIIASVMFGTFCLFNPLFAYLFLNQEWSFNVEFLNLEYKPWRLFLIMVGLPNLICGLTMLMFIPESPKFTFSQNNEEKTLKILKEVYRRNTGNHENTFPTKFLIKEAEDENGERCEGFFKFMWSQTVPLFKPPHLRNTLTACFIQFCIFNCSNGFWTFFPEIVNKITKWMKNNSPGSSANVCEILDDFKMSSNVSLSQEIATNCHVKLEFSTFQNAVILLCLYIFLWMFISLIINRVGKLAIIMTILIVCGSSAFSLTFVNIPNILSYLYVIILADGIAISVVNASTIELYPTKLRAMAVCISLMIGRLGAVVGSNIVGLLIANYCKYIFLMPAILLTTMRIKMISKMNINSDIYRLDNLPIEILMNIFSYVPDKWNLSQVCRYFYEIICKVERKSHKLNISDEKMLLDKATFQSIMNSQRQLLGIKINITTKMTKLCWDRLDKILIFLNLKSISIISCDPRIETHQMLCEILLNTQAVNVLLELSLTSVNIEYIRKFMIRQSEIKYLSITGAVGDSSIINKLNLSCLKLIGPKSNDLATIISQQPNLVNLKLTIDTESTYDDEVFNRIVQLTKLEALDIPLNDKLTPAIILNLEKLRNLHKLNEIVIDSKSMESTTKVMRVFKNHGPNLKFVMLQNFKLQTSIESLKTFFEDELRLFGREELLIMNPEKNQNESESHCTLESALGKTGFGKFNYFFILLTGMILGSVFLETVSINFILPVAQCDLNLSNQDKGILSGIGFIGIIVSSHLWGFLADTRGRKTVIVPTLFGAFVITIISSFVKSFWLLVALRFVNGFLVSGPSATVFAYLGEFHSERYRSKVMMLASATYGLTCYWNPIFASIIINRDWTFYIAPLDLVFKPWRLFMIVCGIPNIICSLITLFFMPESPKFTFSNGDEEKTLKTLQSIYSRNTGNPKESFQVKSLVRDAEYEENSAKKFNNFLHFMWSQTAPLFKHPHLRNTLTVCFMQFCIYNCSNGFWTFFPEITNRISLWHSSDPTDTSATICEVLEVTKVVEYQNQSLISLEENCVTKLESSAYGNVFILNTIYTVGWYLLSTIINCAGKLIIITTLLFTCSGVAIALMFVNIPTVSSYLYIILLTDGLALTVVNASIVELFPTKFRAMALCLALMCGRLGSVIGSNVIGLLLDEYCKYTFLMPAILLASSGLLSFTIPNISKRIK